MSPIRHEDDFRRRPIRSWDSWIDNAIAEAQERGEFDNLPGQGRPLRIESNPFAPELDMAHSVLKNADMAPFWIELGRAIETEIAALAALREQIARHFAAEITRHNETDAASDHAEAPPEQPAARPRWWPFRRRSAATLPAVATIQRPGLAPLETERERARAGYLERAARLDKMIREYHDALPANLWHLQRTRLTPERAARDFDAAVPSVEG